MDTKFTQIFQFCGGEEQKRWMKFHNGVFIYIYVCMYTQVSMHTYYIYQFRFFTFKYLNMCYPKQNKTLKILYS